MTPAPLSDGLVVRAFALEQPHRDLWRGTLREFEELLGLCDADCAVLRSELALHGCFDTGLDGAAYRVALTRFPPLAASDALRVRVVVIGKPAREVWSGALGDFARICGWGPGELALVRSDLARRGFFESEFFRLLPSGFFDAQSFRAAAGEPAEPSPEVDLSPVVH